MLTLYALHVHILQMTMPRFDEDLLILRFCSAALHASRKAMLPREYQFIPNFYVLYAHPALHALYQEWAQRKNIPDLVANTLLMEYGIDASSALLDNMPYRVVIWPMLNGESNWQLHPDHFFSVSGEEISAYALHISETDWLIIKGELAIKEDFCGKLLDGFITGEDTQFIPNWRTKILMTPLHLDLHFLYAILLHEKGGITPYNLPPFNSTLGILSFVEEHPSFYIALRSLLLGYGNPEMPWKRNIERGLKMLEDICDHRFIDYQQLYLLANLKQFPSIYWQDALRLLLNLRDGLEEGAKPILERLEKMDRYYGMLNSSILRFPPLLFAYLWALSQSATLTKKQHCLIRIEFETKIHHGKVFRNKDALLSQWSDFSNLLPGQSCTMADIANNLSLDEISMLELLVESGA
jgi:hypothetical protein